MLYHLQLQNFCSVHSLQNLCLWSQKEINILYDGIIKSSLAVTFHYSVAQTGTVKKHIVSEQNICLENKSKWKCLFDILMSVIIKLQIKFLIGYLSSNFSKLRFQSYIHAPMCQKQAAMSE